MKSLYRLTIHPKLSLELAWDALEEEGIEILYGSEELTGAELYAYLSSPDKIAPFNWIVEYSLHLLPPVDWEAQWAAHGQNFHDGFLHVDFEKLGKIAPQLRLRPGPGFGDLSHPTTRLMLKMLVKLMKEQIVVDIGCGSGILALAAAVLGSPKVYGIDIDPTALRHAKENTDINHLSHLCLFCTPDDFETRVKTNAMTLTTTEPPLILINMIQSEQEIAWKSLPSLHTLQSQLLASGVREEEKSSYLTKAKAWGWTLIDEQCEEDWLAFHFSMKAERSELTH